MAKKKAARATSRFPKQVFVTWEDDSNAADEGYLSVDKTANGAEHGQSVAIYELREIQKMTVTRELKGKA